MAIEGASARMPWNLIIETSLDTFSIAGRGTVCTGRVSLLKTSVYVC